MISYRNIDIEHVKSAINNPDYKETAFEARIRVRKKIGQKEIEVIYCREAFRDKYEEYLIITAYYI